MKTVSWKHKGLIITDFDVLRDSVSGGFIVQRCLGKVGDDVVTVKLPFSTLPKDYFHAILEWAKKSKVYAKQIGVFKAFKVVYGPTPVKVSEEELDAILD